MIYMVERRRWKDCGLLMLIGPGAAGKSTLGNKLASTMHRHPIDLDREFVRENGQIDMFIRERGYDRYKLKNSELAAEIAASSDYPSLLITSSGFLTPDNPPAALEANLRLMAASYSICLLPSRDLEQAGPIIVNRQLQRPFARDRIQEEETIRARFTI